MKNRTYNSFLRPFNIDAFHLTDGGETFPKLDAPVLLTVVAEDDNPDVFTVTFDGVAEATSYKVYANGTLVGTGTSSPIIINLQTGDYTITVRAFGFEHKPSSQSNGISVIVLAGKILWTGLRTVWTGLRNIMVREGG